MIGLHFGDMVQADERLIRRSDGFRRTVCSGEWPFHIRLARPNPYFANEYVLQYDFILANDLDLS